MQDFIFRIRSFFSTPGRQFWLFVTVNIFILLIWMNFSVFDPRVHPDVELYLSYADLMKNGQIPYRDFTVEYPPLALLLLLIPRLFSANIAGYADGFAILMLAFNLLGLYFASRLSRLLKTNHFLTSVIYTFSFFIIGDIAINRFDVVPAVLSLAAIYYFLKGGDKTAWFVLALGVLTKLYPAVLAPLFIISYLRGKEYKPLLKNLAIFAGTGLVAVLPFLIASPEGFWGFINFHSERGLQLESGYASLLMLTEMLGLTKVEIVLAYSSVDVWAPASDFLLSISNYVAIAAVFACYVFYYRANPTKERDPAKLAGFSVGVLSVLMVTTKIFSTQFVIWLFPLIFLIGGRMRHPAWISFGIIALLSQYIYPHNYGQLMAFEQPAVIFLILRNFLVIALGIAAMYFAVKPAGKARKHKTRRALR
jgi:uncharacterized membrane protein